jgi:hypothetical protein
VKSHANSRFYKALSRLPLSVRQAARDAYKQFTKDPYHPSLHFKQVHPSKPIYSVRINIDYRAVGVRQEDTVIWFWIGSHADYNKMISEL